ncbi:MAG: hypothetical protein NTW50_05715 [Candidatus Berkelbacteria bacterium]|nr:hypothetical protein [Candidatus Berkelbacteria bacterium]
MRTYLIVLLFVLVVAGCYLLGHAIGFSSCRKSQEEEIASLHSQINDLKSNPKIQYIERDMPGQTMTPQVPSYKLQLTGFPILAEGINRVYALGAGKYRATYNTTTPTIEPQTGFLLRVMPTNVTTGSPVNVSDAITVYLIDEQRNFECIAEITFQDSLKIRYNMQKESEKSVPETEPLRPQSAN